MVTPSRDGGHRLCTCGALKNGGASGVAKVIR
jgi:hypothetical protein